MHALAPAAARRTVFGVGDKLLLRVEKDGRFGLYQGENKARIKEDRSLITMLNYVNSTPTRADGFTVEIASQEVLSKRFTLPRQALKSLKDVLGFELERRTPFQRDQMLFDAIVLEDNREKSEIVVEVIFTTRNAVDAILTAWRTHAESIPLNEIRATTRAGQSVVLLRHRDIDQSNRDYMTIPLVVAVVLLSIVAFYSPILSNHQKLTAMEQQLLGLRAEAKQSSNLSRNQRDRSEKVAFLNDWEQDYQPRLFVLKELTELIPNDAWLSELRMSGNDIELRGLAKDATALIQALSEREIFIGSKFRAPLTSAADTRAEKFLIGTTLRRDEP